MCVGHESSTRGYLPVCNDHVWSPAGTSRSPVLFLVSFHYSFIVLSSPPNSRTSKVKAFHSNVYNIIITVICDRRRPRRHSGKRTTNETSRHQPQTDDHRSCTRVCRGRNRATLSSHPKSQWVVGKSKWPVKKNNNSAAGTFPPYCRVFSTNSLCTDERINPFDAPRAIVLRIVHLSFYFLIYKLY